MSAYSSVNAQANAITAIGLILAFAVVLLLHNSGCKAFESAQRIEELDADQLASLQNRVDHYVRPGVALAIERGADADEILEVALIIDQVAEGSIIAATVDPIASALKEHGISNAEVGLVAAFLDDILFDVRADFGAKFGPNLTKLLHDTAATIADAGAPADPVEGGAEGQPDEVETVEAVDAR